MKRNRSRRKCGLQFQRLHALLALALLSTTLGAQVLPPPTARPDKVNELATVAHLFVRGYHFEGNKAFSDAELAKVT